MRWDGVLSAALAAALISGPAGHAASQSAPLDLTAAGPRQSPVTDAVVGATYRGTFVLARSHGGRRLVVKWRVPGESWRTTRRGIVAGDGRVRVRHALTEVGPYRVKVRLPRYQDRRGKVTPVRLIRVVSPAVPVPAPVPTPSEPTRPATPVPVVPSPSDAVDVGVTAYAVGDIGYPGGQAAATAALIPDGATVLATGDLAYHRGTAANFADYYLPAYGRLLSTTYPVPGNHDYGTPNAAAYFDVFGSRVGTAAEPWYRRQVGAWSFYHLNSNCSEVTGCGTGSPQYRWLSDQLDREPNQCVAAVWHHPRWSASSHGHTPAMADMYSLLVERGADVLLTGHEHNYQRFDRLAPDGTASPRGLREFVTGAGGAPLYAVGTATPAPEVWNDDDFGVLELQLRQADYSWRFLTTTGAVGDTGTDICA